MAGNSETFTFYTGSSDGIYVWHAFDVEKVDIFTQNQDEIPILVNKYDLHHHEPIWDLKIHPQSNLLISAGADDSVCLINISDPTLKDVLLYWFELNLDHDVPKETPTGIEWLPGSVQHFVTSYAWNVVTLNDS